MSLVITSNKGQDDNPEFSNAFKPYSYQNRLLNTMRIPPNSEIALQSAKINKNGLFILDRTNADFCHYFGVPIGILIVAHLNLLEELLERVLLLERVEKMKEISKIWLMIFKLELMLVPFILL